MKSLKIVSLKEPNQFYLRLAAIQRLELVMFKGWIQMLLSMNVSLAIDMDPRVVGELLGRFMPIHVQLKDPIVGSHRRISSAVPIRHLGGDASILSCRQCAKVEPGQLLICKSIKCTEKSITLQSASA